MVNSSVDAFGPQQAVYCFVRALLRLGQNADEVVLGQIRQLDANRKPALQLRHQVAGLGAVKGAGGDEQHVVGLHVAVSGLHGRAFDDRQQIALHALPRNIGPFAFAGHDLVDLVDEDDAQVLGQFDRLLM